jgi:hypothetical protein
MEVRPVRHDQVLYFSKYEDKAYSSSVTHAIRRHDAEAHLQEHRDLIPPSHRDVGKAMDLPQVLALHFEQKLTKCLPGTMFPLASPWARHKDILRNVKRGPQV